jgi:predicted esterase YcpF (UPF0227 family)
MEMLIYLHGLNSSSLSLKAAILRQKPAPVAVVVPSYPAHRPDDAVAVLSDFLTALPGMGSRLSSVAPWEDSTVSILHAAIPWPIFS